ncbi:hypothetical protein AB0D57_03345 [Streptomyces sp. NPDC048275]|uniref:hypothetical protein n=1 Tax=Streptomyces sp. NPDC048275 TaxID=3155629 RepID=UPI0034098E83
MTENPPNDGPAEELCRALTSSSWSERSDIPAEVAAEGILTALNRVGVSVSKVTPLSEAFPEEPVPVGALARDVRAERVRKELARGYGEIYVRETSWEYLKGYSQGRTADVLLLLDRRGILVPDADRERIATCNNLDTLTRWFNRAITATSTPEVFAEDPADQAK